MATPNLQYEFIKTVCESIQTIEKEYALYIYKKYITPTLVADQQTMCDTQDEHLSKFMNILFIKKKPMSADNYLQMELDEIMHANEDYLADPKAFPNKKTDHGYPDEFRCNFIKQDKQYLRRCQCKSVDDEFYCSLHINTPNKFLREYENAVNDL